MKKKQQNFLYFTVFVVGAVVLILEILGSRMLSPFYGSTIFVWSSLISVALGFLSLGYFLGGKLADKKDGIYWFYLVIMVASTSTVFSYFLKRPILVFSDNFGIKFGPLVASMLFFFLPFTFYGMATPLAVKSVAKDIKRTGSASGFVFGLSTIGSLFGALATGFFLIPNFRINQIIFSSSVFIFLLGLSGVLSINSKKKDNKFLKKFLFLLFSLFLAGVFIRNSNWPKINHQLYEKEILYEKETLGGRYELVGIPRALDGKLCLLIDSTNQGCVIPGKKWSGSLYGYVSDVVETLPPDSRVLILGGGVGQYLHDLKRGDVYYDVVDISPDIEKIYDLAGVAHDNKINFITSDARTYLRKNEAKYDVIFNDLLGNATPVENTFTREFFELSRDRLNKNGVLVTHVIGKTNGEDKLVNSVLTTILGSYKNLYFLSDHPDRFFSYVMIVAGADESRMELVQRNAFERGKRDSHNVGEFVSSFTRGEVITDEINFGDLLWASNMEDNLNTNDFRLKFKRLGLGDYL